MAASVARPSATISKAWTASRAAATSRTPRGIGRMGGQAARIRAQALRSASDGDRAPSAVVPRSPPLSGSWLPMSPIDECTASRMDAGWTLPSAGEGAGLPLPDHFDARAIASEYPARMRAARGSLVAILLLTPVQGPVVLPRPTGPSPVGTAVDPLVDESRQDADFPLGRPITLQLWYPAVGSSGVRAPYLMEEGLAKAMTSQGYYDVEVAALESWAALPTSSRLDAPPAPGSHPLATLSVGLGVVRANYTTLAEELASHGTVVALVESPLAGLMGLPDGKVVQDTTDRLEKAEGHRAAVDEWARDVSFVLDQLQSKRAAADVAATIDWTRAGAIGHSSGGLVAVQACATDARLRAAIDLDGGLVTPEGEPLARFVEPGPTKPALILRSKPLYDDADFARRGLTREQWEARGASGKAALEALAARSPAPLTVATVAGTGHFSFSDAPFVMPAAITRFGGRVIDARRGWLVITGAIRAFLDGRLAPQPGHAFDEALEQFPELEVRTRGEGR